MVTLFSSSYLVLGDQILNGIDDFGVTWITEKFEGWEGSPSSTIQPVQKVRSNGSWSGDAYMQPRSMAASGTILAPTEAALYEAVNRLNDACALYAQPLEVHETGRVRHASVRRSDAVIADSVDLYCKWSIQVVADDPRKLWDPLTASTTLGSSTGGLTFPHTFAHTFPAITTSGSVSLINSGNEAGPVTMRIDGPVAGPVVTHVASGRQLVFSSSLVLGAGEWLDIDMDAKTVLANGQSSRAGYIISRGWSQFEVGANTWAFSASSFNPASLLTVTAVPADK